MEELFVTNIYGECQTHNKRPLLYICTSNTEQNHLKCNTCIVEQMIQPNHLLKIDDILNCDSKTIFQNFPVYYDEEIISEIKQISGRESSCEFNKKMINDFFEEVKKRINLLIHKLQTEALLKAEILDEFPDKIMNVYNKLSMKDELKQVITNATISGETKSNELNEIMKQISLNQKIIQQSIRENLNDLKSLEISLNIEKARRHLKDVLNKLSKMELFELEYEQGRKNIPMEFIKANCCDNNEQLCVEKLIEKGFISYLLSSENNVELFTVVSKCKLEPNLAYVFRVTYNLPLNSHTGSTTIGLIEDCEINNKIPKQSRNGCIYSFRENPLTIIKGQNLTCDSLKNSINSLEFRVCIAHNQIQLADFPHYQNINVYPTDRIYPNRNYHFGIQLQNPGDRFSLMIHPVQIMQDRTQITNFK